MEIKTDEDLLASIQTMPLQKIDWSTLVINQSIGAGGYGTVYQGQWHGIDVAIKQLYLTKLPEHLINEFQNETEIMAQCQFEHIVRLYGVCAEDGHYAMVMEYLPKGSLYQILHKRSEKLPWNPLRWQMAIDIGKGLSYLHHRKIIHRDLKSLNKNLCR